jgi:hypothetical protein
MAHHLATLEEVEAFKELLAYRDSVPYGTDWNLLPPIPDSAYPFLGYTIKVWWEDGHGFYWHADDIPDRSSIEEVYPGIRLLTYSAD